MKHILFCISLLSCLALSGYAQTADDVAKNINKIKRDTTYIYGETTMKDLSEAYNGARAILEMKVGDWVRSQHPDEGIEVCIVKAKEHFIQLETRRGDFYRAFVYVQKSDILPIADKSEVTVLDVSPIAVENQAKPSIAFGTTEEKLEETVVETPTLELTSTEKEMRQIRSFYDVEPYINGMKSKGRIKAYGKYATMPEDEDCHLFVYDQQGNISALLRKSGTKQYNLNTLKEDNVKNHKNCGAIWFQMK